MAELGSDFGWMREVASLAAQRLYGDGEVFVSGYDSSGSSLLGASLHPGPPTDLVEPARRWRGAPADVAPNEG